MHRKHAQIIQVNLNRSRIQKIRKRRLCNTVLINRINPSKQTCSKHHQLKRHCPLQPSNVLIVKSQVITSASVMRYNEKNKMNHQLKITQLTILLRIVVSLPLRRMKKLSFIIFFEILWIIDIVHIALKLQLFDLIN